MTARIPLFRRSDLNPILTAADVPYPANSVFNPGAARIGDETILLVRVEGAIGAGFWQHGQDALLRAYVEPYAAVVPRLWSRLSPVLAMSLTARMFPSTLVTPDVLALTAQLLDDPALPAGARRVVLEQHDDLRRALHAQQSAAD